MNAMLSASTQSVIQATRSFRAIGTTATVVVTDPDVADRSVALLREEVDAIDMACSRFRADSELEYLHRHSGRTVEVSPLLFDAIEVAVDVARRTHGAVDPTVGNALSTLGYDRDFDLIGELPAFQRNVLGPVVGYGHIHIERKTRSVRIPRGVRLDLGSSAKAYLADRTVTRIATAVECGVLVCVGGDVAVSGPPPRGGWSIGIAHESSASGSEVDAVVSIHTGGLSSSSVAVRTWRVGTEMVHHIIDPSTGYSAPAYWTLVSAAGASCVDANALSTAAIVWGKDAIERLRPFEQPVRLVRHDGVVFTLGGWPEEEAS
jgi:FAD:protein FMN transferase